MGRRPAGAVVKEYRVEVRISQPELELLDALRGSVSRSAYLIGLVYAAGRMSPPKRGRVDRLEDEAGLPDPVLASNAAPDEATVALLGKIQRAHEHQPGAVIMINDAGLVKRSCTRANCFWTTEWLSE